MVNSINKKGRFAFLPLKNYPGISEPPPEEEKWKEKWKKERKEKREDGIINTTAKTMRTKRHLVHLPFSS